MSRCKCDWFDGAEYLRDQRVTGLTQEDEEEIRQRFFGFLIKMPYGQNEVKCHCTKCRETFAVSKHARRYIDVYDTDCCVEIATAKHLELVGCPSCGEEVQVIHAGKMGNQCARMYQRYNFVVFHVESDGWLSALGVECTWDFAGQEWGAELSTNVVRKWMFHPGCALEWRRELVWDKGCGRVKWTRAANVRDPFYTAFGSDHCNKYFVIGMDRFRESEMKYCAADLVNFSAGPYALSGKQDGIIRYLGEYCHRPQLEMLAKIGMVDAIGDLVHRDKPNSRVLNWREKQSLPKFLRLTKANTREFIRHSSLVSVGYLQAIQQATAEGSTDWFVAAFITQHHVTAEQMNRVEKHRHGRTVREIFRYLQKQPGGLWTYLDYIEMAEKLEYNLDSDEVFFPANLHRKHDEAAANIRLKKNEAAQRMYRKRYGILRDRLEYADGDLQIIVPTSAEDIIAEGQQQNNCVAHYVESHLKGKTIILFLRNVAEPQKSLVTIEADPKEPWKLKQVYGYHNDMGKKPQERAKVVYAPWLDKWKDWVKAGSPHKSDLGE